MRAPCIRSKLLIDPRWIEFAAPHASCSTAHPFGLSDSAHTSALAVAAEAEAGVVIVHGTRGRWVHASGCCVAPNYLAWSPDGSRLAFLGADTSSSDTGGVAELAGASTAVFGLTASTRTPVWSPDGNRLAFLAFPERGAVRLYTSDRNGRHLAAWPNTEKAVEPLGWVR